MATIFYGIPSEQNIKRNIDKWSDLAGKPDIFSEKDENLEKYQGKILDEYEVVSLTEALRRYPDADVWVTYEKAGITAKTLLTKLPAARIHFLEADLEYRKGCRFLGNFISYHKDAFSPCCVSGVGPVVPTSGSLPQRLAHWQDYTAKLIDDIRDGKQNPCERCHLLQYGAWIKTIKLNEINFGSSQPGDVCNFRCSYCFCKNSLEHLKKEKDGPTTYEIIRQISEIPEYDREDFIIQLANGEFCANRYCEEMLNIFLKTKWKIHLISNFSIYKEKLATLMETNRIISALVSLDAGTRETFKKIKQVDLLEKVVENLKKYPTKKTDLLVKYIFLEGINDNERDIDGFYEIVKEVGGSIVFSADSNKVFIPYTNTMKKMTLRIIKKAKHDGIKINTNSSYLNPLDAKFINTSYANA